MHCSGRSQFEFEGGGVPRLLRWLLLMLAFATGLLPCTAQQNYLPTNLDLTGDIASPQLESPLHSPLPEQYIWLPVVPNGSRDNTFFFRDSFDLKSVPGMATL